MMVRADESLFGMKESFRVLLLFSERERGEIDWEKKGKKKGKQRLVWKMNETNRKKVKMKKDQVASRKMKMEENEDEEI